MKKLATVPVALLLISAADAPEQIVPPALVEDCEGVAQLKVTDVTIQSATPIAASKPPSGGLPQGRGVSATSKAYCRVAGRIKQTIAFEMWFPAKLDWNGKFLGAGVGGAAGTFNFQDLPRGINRGYAAATTDTGHKASDPDWMLDAEARQNYTHLANHLLAVKGKELAEAFYGRKPAHSYFIGCSGGGRQGLKELQRYPLDYDGIVTGANGPKTPEMTVRRMWELLQRDAHPNLMSRADWQLVADEGIRVCDPVDGVRDGLVTDPRNCKFRIATLTCRPGQTGRCLSAEQVRFAESFYAPLRGEGGRPIDQGLLPGVLVDTGRSQLALGTFGQALRGQKNWGGEGFAVASDLEGIDRVMPELRADDPNIAAFRNRGGKVIQYTGWLDGAVAARMVTEYQEALTKRMGGAAQLANFERLYMLPGVYHCRGGPGPDSIGGAGSDGPVLDAQHDMLTALEDWVERDRAPGLMVATKLQDGKTTRTGLICPYPKIAKYRSGNPLSASSFVCGSSTGN